MDILKSKTQGEILDQVDQDIRPFADFDAEFCKQRLRGRRLDNDAKAYALAWKRKNMNRVYKLCVWCLLCVLFIILLDGFSAVDYFSLPIKVMKYIIYGFVVQGLGLYAIVLYNLFPKKDLGE